MGERTLCRRARRNTHLVITGLGVSIPLAIFGSTALLWLLAHMPILVWAGAALLGWVSP